MISGYDPNLKVIIELKPVGKKQHVDPNQEADCNYYIPRWWWQQRNVVQPHRPFPHTPEDLIQLWVDASCNELHPPARYSSAPPVFFYFFFVFERD